MRKSKYPELLDTIGKKILKRRLDSNMTLIQVANIAGVKDSYISRIERDKQLPSIKVLRGISKCLEGNPYEYDNDMIMILFKKLK